MVLCGEGMGKVIDEGEKGKDILMVDLKSELNNILSDKMKDNLEPSKIIPRIQREKLYQLIKKEIFSAEDIIQILKERNDDVRNE